MLRLKEKPIEWIKFTVVMGLAVNVVVWLLWRRGVFPAAAPGVTGGLALAAVVLSLLRPRWFRGFYRGGMTASFHIGQIIGKVLLTLLFFLVVTPLGLLLRLSGKDLLQLKKPGDNRTGWHPAKNNNEFDRMF